MNAIDNRKRGFGSAGLQRPNPSCVARGPFSDGASIRCYVMIEGRKVRVALSTTIAHSLMFHLADQPPLPSVLLHHHHDFAPTLGLEREFQGADPPRAHGHPLDPRRVRVQAPASSPRRRSTLHEPRSAFPAARSPLRERCRWQDNGCQGQHARGGNVEGGTGAAPSHLDSGRVKTSRGGERLQSAKSGVWDREFRTGEKRPGQCTDH